MTVTATALEILVTCALAVSTLAPVLLIGLFVRDARRGDLW